MGVLFIVSALLLVQSCIAVLETPIQADTAIDKWCVATHFDEGNGPYGFNNDTVINLMTSTGFRIYRQELFTADVALWAAKHGVRTIALVPMSGSTTSSSVQSWVNTLGSIRTSANIDCIEGPNEPNGMWSMNGWSYNGQGFPQGLLPMQTDLWKMVKANPNLTDVPVLGPAWSQGGTAPEAAGFTNASFADVCTWGAWHPYPTNNCFSYPYAYANLSNYFCQSNDPINTNVYGYSPVPYLYQQEIPQLYGTEKPLTVTETGYTTISGGVSETVQGKYIPRLLLEGIRVGYQRTCIYQLIDGVTAPNPTDRESNWGLFRYDLSPKPSATAMKNLITLLQDPGASFSTTPLDLTLAITPVETFTNLTFVHHLLFQKRNGDYLIVFWHEIALNDVSVTPYRELSIPELPVTFSVGTAMRSGTIYSWSDVGVMTSAAVAFTNGGTTFTSTVQDRVRVVQVSPTSSPTKVRLVSA